MPDPLDQLRDMATMRTTPESLDRLRERVARRRRRRRVAVASAAVAALAVAVVAVPRGDGERLQVVDDPESTTTSSTVDAPPGAPLPDGALVAGVAGIQRAGPDGFEVISEEPASLAFAFEDGTVVAQAAASDVDVYPPPASGPVVVIEGSARRQLPLLDGDARLFDATHVDGRPHALVSVRTGFGPDDMEERLLLVDVETGEQLDLGIVGGWEWSLDEAHVRGSLIITSDSFEARSAVAARTLDDGAVAWDTPTTTDPPGSIGVLAEQVLLLRPGFDGPAFEPQLAIERLDLSTGSSLGSEALPLRLAEGLELTSGFCFHVEATGGRLLCDRSDGGPIEIDLDTGDVRPVAGIDEGRVTLPRARATTSEGPESTNTTTSPERGDAACPPLRGDEPVVDRHVVAALPPGFAPDGEVVEQVIPSDAEALETHRRQRFAHPDGRWIELDSFTHESPWLLIEQLHAGATAETVRYTTCMSTFAGVQVAEGQAEVSYQDDRTLLATQEWEYGGFALTGGPGVEAADLLLVAEGLRLT